MWIQRCILSSPPPSHSLTLSLSPLTGKNGDGVSGGGFSVGLGVGFVVGRGGMIGAIGTTVGSGAGWTSGPPHGGRFLPRGCLSPGFKQSVDGAGAGAATAGAGAGDDGSRGTGHRGSASASRG